MVIIIEKSISEEENHNEMGEKNNIHVFTFANIYVFLHVYGPIEDLFIRSSGYNFALKMITARAYGLTVA